MRHRTSVRRNGLLLIAVATSSFSFAPPSAGATPPPQHYPPVPIQGSLPTPCQKPTALTPIPAVDQQKVDDLLRVFAGSSFQGGGPCPNGLVQIMLGPGSEGTAKRIRHVFGPRVVIFIDNQLWLGKPLRSPTCGTLPKSTSHPALRAILTLTTTTIDPGGDLKGSVQILDNTSRPVILAIGQPLNVVLTRPGSRRVVGVYDGAIAGTGYGTTLIPGNPVSIVAIGGSARCDGGIGSALPAGRYDAIAEVTGPTVDEPENPNGTVVFTNTVPVRIR